MNMNERLVAETPGETMERCDGYVFMGDMHRGMMLDEAAKRLNRDVDDFTPEERDEIYRAGLLAEGRTEAEIPEIMREAIIGGMGLDPWEDWAEEKYDVNWEEA